METLQRTERSNTKEAGLAINVSKTIYMITSRNKMQGHRKIRIGNDTVEKAENSKYLGTTITEDNQINEVIETRIYSGICACCR